MLGNINLVRSIEIKGVNTVSWSPRGRFCILAGIRSSTGTLQFWDTQENVLLASEEHYACTNIEWDPTGRYVATCVSSWHVQTDTGFMMWNFTGSVITREIIPGFKQFLWRPRPPTLLAEKDMKKIRKNLKEYSRDFDVEDMAEKNKASREVVEKRAEQMEEWKILAERWADEYEAQREERIALYGFDPQEALAESEDWVALPALASAK
jgi:translation initiation factor 3 subunit B